MRNIQNRYEVCIYDKQRKEMCVSLLLRICQSMFRDTQEEEEEIELEKKTKRKRKNNSNLTFEHAHCTRKHAFK